MNSSSCKNLEKGWLSVKKQSCQKLRRKQKQQAKELAKQKQFQTKQRKRAEKALKGSKSVECRLEKLVSNAPYIPSSVACKQGDMEE